MTGAAAAAGPDPGAEGHDRFQSRGGDPSATDAQGQAERHPVTASCDGASPNTAATCFAQSRRRALVCKSHELRGCRTEVFAFVMLCRRHVCVLCSDCHVPAGAQVNLFVPDGICRVSLQKAQVQTLQGTAAALRNRRTGTGELYWLDRDRSMDTGHQPVRTIWPRL